jgi:hypothetical protein
MATNGKKQIDRAGQPRGGSIGSNKPKMGPRAPGGMTGNQGAVHPAARVPKGQF